MQKLPIPLYVQPIFFHKLSHWYIVLIFSSETNAKSKSAAHGSHSASVPGKPVVPMPATSLNIGMDLWNASLAGATPAKTRPQLSGASTQVASATVVGHEGMLHDHQWIQVWNVSFIVLDSFVIVFSEFSLFIFWVQSFCYHFNLLRFQVFKVAWHSCNGSLKIDSEHIGIDIAPLVDKIEELFHGLVIYKLILMIGIHGESCGLRDVGELDAS